MLLTSIFSVILFGIFMLFFIPSSNIIGLRFVGLLSSGLALILSCILIVEFNCETYYFQHIATYKVESSFLNFTFSFGVDGISIFFFYLSSFLIFLCVLYVWESDLLKEYLIALLSIDLFLLFIFSALDLLLFYIFFEAILIPMYLMIGVWGSRERKIRAVYLFFFILCSVLY